MRLKSRLFQLFSIFVLSFCLCDFVFAQTLAPGAPGNNAQWASAGKQGIGTSVSLESKVWFTLQGGALTEVYYPDVTVANVHLLQFVIVNSKTKKVETERDDATHKVAVVRPDSLTFRQINTAKSGDWKITKTYTTDSERDTVLIDVLFEPKDKRFNDYQLYLYYDPSIKNSGMGDTAWSSKNSSGETRQALLAQDAEISSAIMIDYQGEITLKPSALSNITNGFFGVNDGLTQLKAGKDVQFFDKAEKGNVVQFAQIKDYEREINPASPLPLRFKVALSFGTTPDDAIKTAKASLDKSFDTISAEYEKGWSDYVRTLRKIEPEYQAQFNMAAMMLKAHEDKTHRGANIASLTVPWGGGDNANEPNVGGYHLVWSRDLYQVATAFMALGDRDAADRALDFLFKVQQKPDGSFPQNSWLDGKPFWTSLQLDEVAYPLILAYQLNRNDRETYEKHVKKAADFIVKNGPRTPQERWEEEAGYSPSTIAAEIAGLVCAAEIARRNNDETSASLYLATADDWERKVEGWTATTTGKYGDGNYYLRITQNAAPDKGEKLELNNGAGFFDEREIVDAGFLELVRLGIKSPNDALIEKSLTVTDQVLGVQTPNGVGYYRYNHDGYGEMDDGRRWNWDGKYTGKGRLWALLSGERGQYHLARYAFNLAHRKGDKLNEKEKAKLRLEAMLNFANEGLMIPEQVWDKAAAPSADSQFSPNLKFGEGTGSATPLAWSMAQFIRLAVNLREGRNLDTPAVVYERYVKKSTPMPIAKPSN